jgi:hypothetical protein
MEMSAEAWVAGYAAIIATGALALEIRRWFESGPKISVSVSPDMEMVGGIGSKVTGILFVTAVNTGDTPTTITNLTIEERATLWGRMRRKKTRSFILPDPRVNGAGHGLPYVLRPGEQWNGLGQDPKTVISDVRSGRFRACVYTSHRKRPYRARIAPEHALPKEVKIIE